MVGGVLENGSDSQETMEGGGGWGKKTKLMDTNIATFVKFLAYCLTLRTNSK